MPARLPRFVTWFLLLLALGSLSVGLAWERYGLESLQEHPYLVNVLSGMTGFATSALAITLGVNYFLKRDRVRQWYSVMDEAAIDLQTDIENIAGQLAPRYEASKHMRPVFYGFRSTSESLRAALTQVTYDSPSGEVLALLAENLDTNVGHLTSTSLPYFQQAFEMEGDPGIARAVSTLKRGLKSISDLEPAPPSVGLRGVVVGLLGIVEAISNNQTYLIYEVAVQSRVRWERRSFVRGLPVRRVRSSGDKP